MLHALRAIVDALSPMQLAWAVTGSLSCCSLWLAMLTTKGWFALRKCKHCSGPMTERHRDGRFAVLSHFEQTPRFEELGFVSTPNYLRIY